MYTEFQYQYDNKLLIDCDNYQVEKKNMHKRTENSTKAVRPVTQFLQLFFFFFWGGGISVIIMPL